jgi:hypothetical protein
MRTPRVGAPGHQAIAVVLDLMNPLRAGGRDIDAGRKAGVAETVRMHGAIYRAASRKSKMSLPAAKLAGVRRVRNKAAEVCSIRHSLLNAPPSVIPCGAPRVAKAKKAAAPISDPVAYDRAAPRRDSLAPHLWVNGKDPRDAQLCVGPGFVASAFLHAAQERTSWPPR